MTTDEDDFEDYDHSACQILWVGDAPTPEIIAKVRGEIKTDLCDLADPADLVFHIVLLSDNLDGPCVVLSGMEGGKFRAEYDASVWEKSTKNTT